MRSIFVITTIKYSFDDTRTVGWFENFKTADHVIKANVMDIHEQNNRYCVIEEMFPGVYNCPPVAEHWYKWNTKFQEYCPCEKPTNLLKICNFGIG